MFRCPFSSERLSSIRKIGCYVMSVFRLHTPRIITTRLLTGHCHICRLFLGCSFSLPLAFLFFTTQRQLPVLHHDQAEESSLPTRDQRESYSAELHDHPGGSARSGTRPNRNQNQPLHVKRDFCAATKNVVFFCVPSASSLVNAQNVMKVPIECPLGSTRSLVR